MAKEVFMPKAGMDMQEGTIIRWIAQVGGKVKEGDPLLEIETDKVTMEVESPADGVLLRKYFDDGDTVPVVTVIGYVGQEGESVPDKPTMAGQGGEAAAAQATAPMPDRGSYDYDVAVIGGGPAGYVAAIKVAQLGGKAILFEKDTVGGTCLNRGCIPTKTYLKTAETIHGIKKADKRGIIIDTSTLAVNMEKVHAYKQKVVKRLTGGVASLLKSREVETVKGEAALAGQNSVECDGRTYTAANIILCGGSRPGSIPIPGIDGDRVLNSDQILDMTTIPERLAVIGGGVIGCEIAMAFNGFGSKVTIVELMDRVVPMMDEEVSKTITTALKGQKIKVLTGKKVEAVEQDGDGVAIVLDDGRVEAGYALLSIGRAADLTCLGSLAETVKAEKGKVLVDEYCRTNVDNVYACGDITPVSSLAHSAFKMGEAAATNAMGGEEKANLSNTPSCLYTMPEAASVGMTEEQAKQRGEITVGRFPFPANGRAVASGENAGFVKVIADKQFGEILGVHIVGPSATELIAEAKALMDMEVTVHEAAEIMHAHPTYSEAFMEACADALGKCIHLP